MTFAPASAFEKSHIVSVPQTLSSTKHTPFHSNVACYFRRFPYRFIKEKLLDFSFLSRLPACTCFEFAFVKACPDYTNLELTEEDFVRMAVNSGSFTYIGNTNLSYNLVDPGTKIYRDPYIKDCMKEFDLQLYYRCKDKHKTPSSGHMYFALLGYCFPVKRAPPHKDKYFYSCLDQAMHHVFRNFDRVQPQSAETVIETMPKNTSAGWLANLHFKKAMRKDEILDVIRFEYYSMWERISARQEVSDYVIFAMRGHLSDREKIKTRPIWLVSATTIISELRYYNGFYAQLTSKKFFKDRVITGKKSMHRIKDFLSHDPSKRLVNTDMSGWDNFRARWFHERVMRKAGSLIDFTSKAQRLEYDFCIEQAIRTKVLLPSGIVLKKAAGIISGTAGTLLFNTLLNMVLTYTVLFMMKSIDWEFGCSDIEMENWLGDDFAFYIDPRIPWNLDDFSRLMLKYFDLIVNKSKTVDTLKMDERKYLGYQLKSGFLFRDNLELFQSSLYLERFLPFSRENLAISFSRLFAYLLIGGINDSVFLDFFMYFCGRFSVQLEAIDFIYVGARDNVFKLLKDIWNVKISSFDVDSFRQMNFLLLKYVMFFDLDMVTEQTLF